MRRLAVISPPPGNDLIQGLENAFQILHLDKLPENGEANVADICLVNAEGEDIGTAIDAISQLSSPAPAVVLASTRDVEQRIAALNAGFMDVLDTGIAFRELVSRLNLLVDHRIADRQLNQQVSIAQQVAMQAMASSADMNANMRFLIDSLSCRTLDELGMRLFQTLTYYELQCSLQIRSAHDTKNMESNGMPREMESQLLSELKAKGRFVDFGKRSVINHEHVSLLIRNMPIDNPRKYGQIKDNMFVLLQGLSARVNAMDAEVSLTKQFALKDRVTYRLQLLVENIEESNQHIIRGCATIFEDLMSEIEGAIVGFALNEYQEEILMGIMRHELQRINDQVSQGLQLDESFRRLLTHLMNMRA